MLNKILLPVFGALLLFLTLIFFSPIRAVSLEECEKEDVASDKIGECIDLLAGKVGELGQQKKTLSSQIAQFDNQIRLTQLKISEAQATIDKLEKEIGVLGFRIDYINESVDTLERLLKERIVATYQQSFVSNLELLIASNDFSDLILRIQYIKLIQENDKKVLASLQETKANYSNQKEDRETKQAAIEENKQKLLGLKTQIDNQKLEKQVLLTRAQNDESRYQKLLAQAQAEIAIAFGGGVETYIRDVKQGETIGTVRIGQSGCSTGTHLHYEVHKNGSIEDPNNYLNSSTSYNYWNNNEAEVGSINPRGPLPWPLDAPVQINQGFGWTPYAKGGGYRDKNGVDHPHYGIDMSKGPSTAASVKAAKDGKLYGGSYGGCSYGPLIYAKIKHDDGLDTLYLHMIPR